MAKNLFVGSIPFTVDENALNQLFTTIGQVQSVSIIKDKYTGSSRGFAFVEMVNEEDAKKAIEQLNGHLLEGRNIVVKEALPKPTYTNGRSDGRSRGGFGNRGSRRY